MGYDEWNDRIRELDAKLTMQTLHVRESVVDRRSAVGRWSPMVLKVAGVAAGVLAIRIGPLRFLSMTMAVSRLWPRVLAFRPK